MMKILAQKVGIGKYDSANCFSISASEARILVIPDFTIAHGKKISAKIYDLNGRLMANYSDVLYLEKNGEKIFQIYEPGFLFHLAWFSTKLGFQNS